MSCVFLGSTTEAATLLKWILHKGVPSVEAAWTKPSPPKKGPNPVLQVAARRGLTVFQSSRITKDDHEHLRATNADFGLVVGYGTKLPTSFFGVPRHGMLNLHFSLLPKYRGASPMQTALLNGDSETGVTLQRIGKEIDAGDILDQERFALKDMDRLQAMEVAVDASKKLLQRLFDGATSFDDAVKQDERKASHCKKIRKADGLLTGTETTEELLRKSRAFVGWPGTFAFVHGRRYLFANCSRASSQTTAPQGTLTREGNRLFLHLRDGTLNINTVQEEGKKKLRSADFLNGCRWTFPARIETHPKLHPP